MDKGLRYQEAHRIPLIFYWKGKGLSGNREDLSLNMDILPTLMDLCGLDIPSGGLLEQILRHLEYDLGADRCHKTL